MPAATGDEDHPMDPALPVADDMGAASQDPLITLENNRIRVVCVHYIPHQRCLTERLESYLVQAIRRHLSSLKKKITLLEMR